MKKLISFGLSLILIGFYLIYSYNGKGHSVIYDPIYIRIKADLPENSRLDINYTTINDPVTPQKAYLLLNDTIPEGTFLFRIDSSHRVNGFRLFLLSLHEKEKFIISEIKAYNVYGGVFNFSLNSKDLIATDNLVLNDLGTQVTGSRKEGHGSPSTPSLFFDLRGSFKVLFVSSGARDPDIPSLFASAIILMLISLLLYLLYPLRHNLRLKGISPGAWLLALAILILPTGEKLTNLLIIISIATGLITNLMDKSLRSSLINNKFLLAIILFSIVIYTLSYLISNHEAYSKSIWVLKLGFPITLLSILINVRESRELRLQYVALIAGVIISVFIHFGWMIIFLDSMGLKSKLMSNPLYYFESSIFSRVHHSYLSVLYLVCLSLILFKQEILNIGKKERIAFSIVILIMVILAFSRAAILSLVLILIYRAIRKLTDLNKIDVTPLVRLFSFVILTVALLTFIFIDFKIEPSPNNRVLSGLQTRLYLWENASSIIKEKPLTGWGPNGYRVALNDRNNLNINYSNYGMNLSTHNQFLSTSGMFGVLIGIGLIWFLIFPTGFSKKSALHSAYIFTIAIIFITNFLFESFLNRNLGIIIFGVVYGLLIRLNSIPSMNQKNQLS
jgi:O-antigen ligase